MGHIGSLLQTPSKTVSEGTIDVNRSLLNYLVKDYNKGPDGYRLKPDALEDDHFKELFSFGLVSPVVISDQTVKEAFTDEATLLASIGLLDPYVDDPLGKKLVQWNRALQKFFGLLTHDNNIQEIVYNTTERMMLEYIKSDPEANDALTLQFSEYMLKQISSSTYTENIRFGIQSMIKSEKRPVVHLSELGRHLFRNNPEFSTIRTTILDFPYKKRIPLEVYGTHWGNAYLNEVADRIIDSCYSYVAVNLIDSLVEQLLGMTIDMVHKNRIEQEQSKISEKIAKLTALKTIVAQYNE
jgi:hypothetical protein